MPPAFQMVGDADAGACVDGVCAVPAPVPATMAEGDSGENPQGEHPG